MLFYKDHRCRPGCHEVKLKVRYAEIKVETIVVGCRKSPFPSNARSVFILGQGYVWQCVNGYEPTMAYQANVLYDDDDKLVFKQGKGVLIDCMKAD